MNDQKIYQALAVCAVVLNRENLSESQKDSWNDLLDRCMEGSPSGSGFDDGTTFHLEESSDGKRLVFSTSFHHMDEHGYYCGWTSHNVILYPEFSGYRMRVTGRNRNQIKDMIGDAFRHWLDSEAPKYRFLVIATEASK